MADWMRYLIARIRYALAGCEFVQPSGSTVRTCPVCGRSEELDIDDGASLNAWHMVRAGDPEAHFRHLGKSALPLAVQSGSVDTAQLPEIAPGEHEPIPVAE